MITAIKARFLNRHKTALHLKELDAAYVQGAINERMKILAMMDELIEKNRGMDSWTALLRQARNTLGNHHDGN